MLKSSVFVLLFTYILSIIASGFNGGVFIPFYVYPESEDWSTLETTASNYTNVSFIVIINVNSGPGTSQESSYVNALSSFRSSNVKFLGYVYTMKNLNETSFRNNTEIEQDVDSWYDFYGPYLSGIFFDEAPNRWTDAKEGSTLGGRTAEVAFYQNLSTYVKSKTNGNGTLVALNPGSPCWEEFYDYSDFVVILESNIVKYLGDGTNCSRLLWTKTPPTPLFPTGEWCSYVPDWDGVNNLRSNIINHVPPFLTSKSAVLLYSAAGYTYIPGQNWSLNPSDIKTKVLSPGVGIGWYYVMDVDCGVVADCWGKLTGRSYLIGLLDALENDQEELPETSQLVETTDTRQTAIIVSVVLVVAVIVVAIAAFFYWKKIRKNPGDIQYQVANM